VVCGGLCSSSTSKKPYFSYYRFQFLEQVTATLQGVLLPAK
jgi:hypothetical protein